MKINKNLIILSLLLIFCISLGAVSATDNMDDVSVYCNDSGIIEVNSVSGTDNEDITNVLSADSGDFAELQSVINQASSGSTIYLTKDYTFVSGDDNGVSISKPLTIDGQGHTINGSGTTRAFHVTNDNVVIRNINFVNTYQDNKEEEGGAIYVDGIATISDCNFTDSYCRWEGGAIFIRGGTISNCNFNNCKANDDGGAIAIWDHAGTVIGCNFTNCHIKDNDDDYDGGAIYLRYGGTVSGCNFLNCSHDGGGEGGAICADGTATISDCSFTNTFCNYEGGAIFVKGIANISNCNFNNCSADDDGGAIAIWEHSGTVSDCTFTNCYIDKNGDYDGGAIYFDNDGNVTGCNFLNCSNYGGHGGAVYLNGESSVLDCNFTDSFCNSMGGAIFIKGGTISNCIFTNCSSNTEGGAITIWENSGTVSDCAFINCYIDRNWYGDPSDGGAVYFSDEGTVSNCNFTNCYCLNSLFLNEGNDGGAISINGDKGTVSNCNFMNCHADSYGGAVYFSAEGTVSNSNFTNCAANGNTTYHYGGAICIKGDKGTVNDCVFFNSSASYGGAIFIAHSSDDGWWTGYATVTDCSFVDCSAYAGVIFSGTSNVKNCNFTNCNGSGIACGGLNDDTIISDCVFTDCYDDDGDGGAINIVGGQISDCNFTNCYVGPSSRDGVNWYGSGGAIYIYSHGGSISNCNFLHCFSYNDGGAILIDSSGTVTNCSFINCYSNSYKIDTPYYHATAHSVGGAIAICDDATITDSIFIDCYASSEGGAIYVGDDAEVSNCNFTNCNTTSWNDDSTLGGAIAICDYSEVTYCNFLNCFATAGGALMITEGDIEYCNFLNCYAKGFNSAGGAICRFGEYTDGDIIGCNFINCYATGTNCSLGGAIFNSAIASTWDDSNCCIQSCNFVNCHADNDGGAIYVINEKGDDFLHIGLNMLNLITLLLSPETPGIWHPILFSWKGQTPYTSCDSLKFINCTANSKGGAICLEYIDDITSCEFINCYAKDKGSSIFITHDSESEIVDSSVISRSDDYKAPIYNDGHIKSDIEIITIENKTKHVDNGQVVNLNATVTTSGIYVAGGELIFTVNGKDIKAESDVNGIYSTNYAVDFTGTKSVDGDYDDGGDSTVIMGSLTTDKIEVNLASDNVRGTPGEKLNVTIKVTDINNDPVTGGVVTVKFEGSDYLADVVNGVVTVELYLPCFGEYSASAFYNGSLTSAYNDASLDFTVYAKDFASVAVYAKDNITYGEILTVYGYVTGVEGKSAPTGNVTVYVDGVEKGTVNLTENDDIIYFIPNLAGGKHIITLRYNGNENYAFEEGSANVTVFPAIFDDLFMIMTLLNDNISWYFAPSSTPIPPHSLDPIPMIYDPNHAIASSPNNSISNEKALSYNSFNPYLLLANGQNNGLNGKILLILDGHIAMVDLINTHANLTCNSLGAGIHRVTAIFLGNENYTRLKASAIFYVPKSSSSTVCTVEDADYGDNVTVTVNVGGVGSKVPTGYVTILINNEEIDTVTITNGAVTYSIPNLVSGNYNITVIYSGDKNYNASEFSGKFTVNRLNVIVGADSVKGNPGEKVNITVKVTDKNGNLVKEGKVTIKFNGKEYEADVVNGIATIEVILPDKVGTYSGIAYYEGFNYNSSYAVFGVEVINGTNPINNSGIPMEATANPLIVLLIALTSLPIIRRRK